MQLPNGPTINRAKPSQNREVSIFLFVGRIDIGMMIGGRSNES
jgi:hypothetical protein